MRPNLTLVYDGTELAVNLPADGPTLSAEAARRWLDEQFVANDCEPLRVSGKVLTADKLLAIAHAVGLQGFQQDEALRLNFARAATAALARPSVRIDVSALSVTY